MASPQALKDTHAPQAAAALLTLDVAVLFKLVRLNVIARGQTAAGAVRVIVRDDISSETPEHL
jgi:hypothetical protein